MIFASPTYSSPEKTYVWSPWQIMGFQRFNTNICCTGEQCRFFICTVWQRSAMTVHNFICLILITSDSGEECCLRLLKRSFMFVLLIFCISFYSCFVITVRSYRFPFVICWLEKFCQTLLTHDQLIFNIFGCNCYLYRIALDL